MECIHIKAFARHLHGWKSGKTILLSLKNQRYERKKLWKIVCEKMNAEIEPYPENLGEDDLAQFGAYREFES